MTLAKSASVDFDDLKEGFSFSGKQQRINEWRARKEEKEFRIMCTRLRVRKRMREIYADGGERLERERERRRAWEKLPEVVPKLRAAQRRRRQAAYKAAPDVRTCIVCGATFCRVPWARDRNKQKLCGKRCFNRNRYLKARARAKGVAL